MALSRMKGSNPTVRPQRAALLELRVDSVERPSKVDRSSATSLLAPPASRNVASRVFDDCLAAGVSL